MLLFSSWCCYCFCRSSSSSYFSSSSISSSSPPASSSSFSFFFFSVFRQEDAMIRMVKMRSAVDLRSAGTRTVRLSSGPVPLCCAVECVEGPDCFGTDCAGVAGKMTPRIYYITGKVSPRRFWKIYMIITATTTTTTI